MTDQERVTVWVHDIPVDVKEVERLMTGARVGDEAGAFMGATEGALSPATFEVEMSDGSRPQATYPSEPAVPDTYVIELMERRLRSRREDRLDVLSDKRIEFQAAHPRAARDRPVDFLVTFAEFGAMVDGTWQLDIPPEVAVEQTGRIARLIELSNLLKP